MDQILEYFNSISFDPNAFFTISCTLLFGSTALGLISRFALGQKSILNISVSSSFSILFIYIFSFFLTNYKLYPSFAQSLPFVSISGQTLLLIDFFHTKLSSLCSEILSMIVLSFLVNFVDSKLPNSKKVFRWLLYRLLTVIICWILHLLTIWLLATYLPSIILTYAPIILLAILILTLLTGSLKIVVGALISTVNPIIGGLYTFFFANVIGKQITKAILTTTILAAAIIVLRYIGIASIVISSDTLLPYLPILLLMVVIWYLLSCVL